VDLTRLREKCDRLQWSVDDVDWAAPGAETVSPAQGAALAPFMSDLFWIESTAAVVFTAMAANEADPTRRAIFESFAVDEHRHAEAERLLMVRWGLLGRHQRPEPNSNVRRLIDTLERHAARVSPSVFSAIIPLTELVLDGALVRYLLRAVDDPVCHRAFEGINADEARHLAMDFYMLEHYGGQHSRLGNTIDMLRAIVHPRGLYALFFGYLPTLSRSRENIVRIGLDLEEVGRAMRRYIELGDRNPAIARHPTYQMMRRYVDRTTSGQGNIGDAFVRLSDILDGVTTMRGAA
jgi:hypothetical protein